MQYLAVLALCSGCSFAIGAVVPDRKVVRHATRTQAIAVRSVPSEASVSNHGAPVTTPSALEASFEVELVHREKREIAPFIGIGTGAATATAGGLMSRGNFSLVGMALVIGGVFELVGTGNRIIAIRRKNKQAAINARETPIPRALELAVRWPDGVPQVVRVSWPEQRFLTIVRPAPATFDEALIAWAEAGERTPSPEGLFNLGVAYAGRAAITDRDEDRRKALAYFERYLKTEVSDARRARVEELARPLRGAP